MRAGPVAVVKSLRRLSKHRKLKSNFKKAPARWSGLFICLGRNRLWIFDIDRINRRRQLCNIVLLRVIRRTEWRFGEGHVEPAPKL